MKSISLVIGSLLLLNGCASTFEAMGRDPVRVEKVEVPDSSAVTAVSLSAEKRNVVVGLRAIKDSNGLIKTDGKGNALNRTLYCAEPPPEVAKAFDIDRSINIDSSGQMSESEKAKVKADIKGTVKEALTVLGQRTVLLDVYRTATYALCQFYMNEAIDEKELVAQFSSITTQVLTALSKVEPTADKPEKK